MPDSPNQIAERRTEEAILKALYDALRVDQLSPIDPTSDVSVGALDLRRSAIFTATEANWRKWVRNQ